jgi:cytochrome c peroxidase
MGRKGLICFCIVVVIVSTAAIFDTSFAQSRNNGGNTNNGQVPIDLGPGLPPPIPDDPLAPLSTVPVPDVPGLNNYIFNRSAAIALGKALFWDMQAGSDGVQACASCHFNAGADSRATNQVNPGSDGVFNVGVKMSGNVYPNYHLYAGTPDAGWGGYHNGDFPLHKLSNVDLNNTVISDTNDVVGSQGEFPRNFNDIKLGSGIDDTSIASSAVYSFPDPNNPAAAINVRQVTGRNTPSNVNAVYNYRNFWDGRAMNVCNGANPFGERDTTSHFFVNSGTTLSAQFVRLQNSALCSQALGPALSPVEMSANGRIFRELGRKLFAVNPLQQVANTTPLGKQNVDPTDSVLGSMTKHPLKGLKTTYAAMVKAAFQPRWWNSQKRICVNPDNTETLHDPAAKFVCKGSDYSQMEYNFSVFWGLSIQMYESTLRSDQTPLDQYLATQKVVMLNTDGQRNGYQLTLAPGVTPYTVSLILIDPSLEFTAQEIYAFDNGKGQIVGVGISTGTIDYTTGNISFLSEVPISNVKPLRIAYSVGQTPMTTAQLRGLQVFQVDGRCIACHGGPEMSNASVTHNRRSNIERMLMRDLSVKVYDNGFYNIGTRPVSDDIGIAGNDGVAGLPLSAAESERQQVCNDPTLVINVPARLDEGIGTAPLDCNDESARDGNFKAPMLRGVALTAPYFHNGGQLTLEQVVEYYDRGGDFTDGLNIIPNIDADIQPLGLTDQQKSDLVDFLRNGLTDLRVVKQAAPFDHPQLFLPDGHPVDTATGYPVKNDPSHPGQATDLPYPMFEIPATGRKGGAPQKTFLENALAQ